MNKQHVRRPTSSAPPVRLSSVEARLLVAVGAWRKTNGEGPPWLWLRRSFGLKHRQLGRILPSLQRRGLVEFAEQPGSISVTPLAAKQALRLLRDELGRGGHNAEMRAAWPGRPKSPEETEL